MHHALDTRSALSRGAYLFQTLIVFAVVGLLFGLNFYFLRQDALWPLACFVAISMTVLALGVMTLLTLKRMRDVGCNPIWALLLYIPGINAALWLMLVTLPGRTMISRV